MDDDFLALIEGGEGEALGVEHEAFGAELVFAVYSVAIDGGVHVAHVYAELVGAAGEEEEAHELFGFCFLFDDVAGVGEFSAAFDCHHFVILIGHGDEIGFDVAGMFEIVGFGDDGYIFFCGELFFEDVVEILIEAAGTGEEEDAGGVFV